MLFTDTTDFHTNYYRFFIYICIFLGILLFLFYCRIFRKIYFYLSIVSRFKITLINILFLLVNEKRVNE